jgi:hypothetical protein
VDNATLRKKLSTYKSDKGYLKNVSDDVLYEVLVAWENWSGPIKDFYRSLGFSHSQMASVVAKAKQLRREGRIGDGEFKAVKIEGQIDGPATAMDPCRGVEVVWGNGRIIRFAEVDMLLDFLKKSA